MEDLGMTARVSAFSRAFHNETNEVRIFSDNLAKQLLSESEYKFTASQMAKGINFFNPTFAGSDEEALRWVTDRVLSPTPLGRAAFTEQSLEKAVQFGVKQYLICAAGFDSFAYRSPNWAKNLRIFELDYPSALVDKQNRLEKAGIQIPDNVSYVGVDFSKRGWEEALMNQESYDKNSVTFCSFLGIIYYLTKDEFESLLRVISDLIPENSTIIFDYPDEQYFDSQVKHAALAKASNESMQACYSYEELIMLLQKYHFQIFEYLDKDKITSQIFKEYNEANPNYKMEAQNHVCYCMAVKKGDL